MPKVNPGNERIKRQYFMFLREAARYDETTVDAVAKSLDRFEADTGRRDFRAFRREQAMAFKRRLREQTAQRSGRPLSKATIHATLSHLKRFFHWLAGQPGFRSRVQYSDAEYFNDSEKDARTAAARRPTSGPTLDQVLTVIRGMPHKSEIQRRDRAVVAFILLTGARDSAAASMRLKHVDIPGRYVDQDAREVRTKNSKSFRTHFFPVGQDVDDIVTDWVLYLRHEKGWPEEAPLFPATAVSASGPVHQFTAGNLQQACWSTATPIRHIFRKAFQAAGLPYFNPHSIRKTLVALGQVRCQTPEELKVWSQNLGHENVLTTLLSYGHVAGPRHAEIMNTMRAAEPPIDPEFVKLVQKLQTHFIGSKAAEGR